VRARARLAKETTVDTAAPFDDDQDLDTLMLRVRDAALAGVSGGGPLQPPTAGEANADGLEITKVLEAQANWNEQARQSLVALLDGIRTLRDDWAEAQAELRRQVAQLSAVVDALRAAAPATAARAAAPAKGRSGTSRTAASSRRTSKRRLPAGRGSRS